LETHRFDLVSLVGDCVALVSANASKTGVKINSKISTATPRHFEGDSFRLRQVLLNLMANAIKFTPAGGHVELVIASAATQTNHELVRFEVRDTGIGIDESAIKQLFERFTQADSSTTRRYGGTGLGLAISSRVVVMMGGRLEVQSIVGRGSSFYFTVPFRAIESSLGAVAPPRQRLTRLGLHVLVAEDNAINRKIISAQLEALGCSCVMAVDGQEALVVLQQESVPDVILMDCHMPNLDGWEATKRLRGWAGEENATLLRRVSVVPVIALTAAALPEERARCLDAGMSSFLSKPVKLADLHCALMPYATAVDVN
jgi:CheY-like chemotaxis protein